jgi:hypothetical protein
MMMPMMMMMMKVKFVTCDNRKSSRTPDSGRPTTRASTTSSTMTLPAASTMSSTEAARVNSTRPRDGPRLAARSPYPIASTARASAADKKQTSARPCVKFSQRPASSLCVVEASATTSPSSPIRVS